MPGTIRGITVGIGTLPYSLCTAFSESIEAQVNINEYHDGSSQRTALVTTGRRSWKLSKRLTMAQIALLSDFYESVRGFPFYFYNPVETLPPYSQNPIGTSGRYIVRFNNDRSQVNGMGRFDINVELIETTTAGATAVGTSPGTGVTPPPPTTWSDSFGPGVPVDANQAAGTVQDIFGYYQRSYIANYGPISYGGWMWTFTLNEGFGLTTRDRKITVYKSQDGVNWIRQDVANAPRTWVPSAPYWDGVSSTVTILAVDPLSTTATLASLVIFDMATGLFGGTFATTDLYVRPAGAVSGLQDPHILRPYVFRLSNGTFRLVYTHFYRDFLRDHDGSTGGAGATQGQVYYQDYVGGSSWSPRKLFPNQSVAWQTTYFLGSATQDGDVIHCFYTDNIHREIEIVKYNYVRINADGTFSLPQVISPYVDGSEFGVNTGVISGNNLLIPVQRPANTPRSVGVLVGSPKASPTFSYIEISAPNSPIVGVQIYQMSQQVVFAWIQSSANTGHDSQIWASISTNNGASWSTPSALVLDLDATPATPVSGRDTRFINSISLGTNLNGTLGLMYTTWAAYYAPQA